MQIRMKLILSYALIIVICLGLTTLVGALLLRTYQNRFTKQRIEIIAETTAPLLHDNNDPTRFDATMQLDRTAEQTQTRLLILEGSLRDLTNAQNRNNQNGANIKTFAATVRQDTAGLLPENSTVAVPREIYERWQQWTRTQQAAQATPTATPTTKNAQLTLPRATTIRLALQSEQPLELTLLPLRGERGMPSGNFRILVVAEPVGTVARPLATLVRTLLPAAAVVFLCSIGVALLLASSITTPLRALAKATRALAGGDYSQRVPVRGTDEVAELGRSFNSLASDIASARRREHDILANISHDLKTPLTSIQGFAGAMLDGTCPPEAYPYAAQVIHTETERMNHLVGDVLQLSRLEAGEFPLHPMPLNVREILQATVRRFTEQATKQGVFLRVVRPNNDDLTIRGDRDQIEQILGNLVENALRYTPPEGRIDLLAERITSGGKPVARISVRDTGKGIAASDLPRIFERFYQADKSRVAGQGGSGLGLAITKELVERHHGTVTAESVIGAGTTISFTIPLDQPMPASQLATPLSSPQGGQ